jgi:hypothetical protein
MKVGWWSRAVTDGLRLADEAVRQRADEFESGPVFGPGGRMMAEEAAEAER